MALVLPRTVGVEEDEVAAAVLGLLRLMFLAEKLDHSGTDLRDMETWVGDARTNGDDDGVHPAGRRRRAWRGELGLVTAMASIFSGRKEEVGGRVLVAARVMGRGRRMRTKKKTAEARPVFG